MIVNDFNEHTFLAIHNYLPNQTEYESDDQLNNNCDCVLVLLNPIAVPRLVTLKKLLP